MKKNLLLVFFLLIGKITLAQTNSYGMVDSVKSYLDKGLTVLQTNALNRDAVNWNELRTAVYQKAQGAKTYEEVLPIYTYIFEQLNDYHGWLTYKGKAYSWQKKPREKNNPAVEAELKKKRGVRVQLLPNGIGYISIPGNSDFGMKNINKNSQAIRDSIRKLHHGTVKGWIVDLRLNGGGNMYPMFGGLAELLGDGNVGGFVTKDGGVDEQWNIKGGNFYINTAQVTDVKSKEAAKSDAPIAVLVGPVTASAGEALAISFKGRASTKFFGETTYGLTTANNGFVLDANSGINIAVLYEADRNGVVYKENVQPDVEVIGGDNFIDLEKDQKVMAAVKWLKKEMKSKQKKVALASK